MYVLQMRHIHCEPYLGTPSGTILEHPITCYGALCWMNYKPHRALKIQHSHTEVCWQMYGTNPFTHSSSMTTEYMI